MWLRVGRERRVAVIAILVLNALIGRPDRCDAAGEAPSSRVEFSATLVKKVNGKQHQAQVFAKGDRLRLEYKYALRTDFGYAAIEIVRLDLAETWYVLAQQKILLALPLDPDDALPVRPELPGESGRMLVGDATVAGRAATLFEVQTSRHGRSERFYEWVDIESGVVLKLISRDRDWAFEYERFRLALQPGVYFDAPPGYMRRNGATGPQRRE
jgi:hypothetical protein